FTDGQGPLPTERTLPQPAQMLCARVFGPVDDPQVFASAAFYRRLRQVAAPLLHEAERLDHHTLAARLRQRLPPRRCLGLACGVREINLPPGSFQKKLRIG